MPLFSSHPPLLRVPIPVRIRAVPLLSKVKAWSDLRISKVKSLSQRFLLLLVVGVTRSRLDGLVFDAVLFLLIW